MIGLRHGAVTTVAALIVAVVPSAAGATAGEGRARASAVDFGTCTEYASGTTVALSELRERVPRSVPVLSLSDQGVVFPGSDELGVLILRALECESISVTRHGKTRTQYDRSIAQVGTAIDTTGLPATPFNKDGGNGADFNNYIFAYYSDSRIYRNAMRRAGVRNVASARIDIHDETVDECVLDRTVSVRPHTRRSNYGFTATGTVPDAACEPAVVPFIGNWWSVSGGKASVLSNTIAGQSAAFFDLAETTVTIEPGRRSQLFDVFDSDSAVVDAFGLSGVIPEADGLDMVILRAGRVSSP